MYCPSCGRAIPNDSRVCAYCGKPIPSHGVLTAPDQENKKDKLPIIIVLVLCLLIIIPVAIAATVYVYVSGMIGSSPSFNTPSIVFTQDDMANTLTVQYVSSSTVLWSDIDVQGECDTSGQGMYVTVGDTLTNCTGTIRLVYVPTYTSLGSWTFT